MHHPTTRTDARDALAGVAASRARVAAEVGLPGWYRWDLALGWIVVGLVTDLASPWVAALAAFAFGTLHAAVASRVAAGRRRSGRLTVRAEVAGHRLARRLVAGLIGLMGLTVAAAIVVAADGAGHPVTIASVLVATIIVLAGPGVARVPPMPRHAGA